MKVAVLGAGHVGLPTAAALAHLGHMVSVADVNEAAIASLESGSVHFFEPGLAELVDRVRTAGRLRFTASVAEGVAGAEVVFICVGTPPAATGAANLSAVEQAAEQISRAATGDVVVVEKSTVPAGTAERIGETLGRYGSTHEFAVVSNPEFLREGRAVDDSLKPSRIVVGSDSAAALGVMRELYAPLIDAGVTWLETDIRTAELAKHAANAFLSLKVSYANALARICELAGADVVAVTDIMGADPRIGRAHLHAGLGYGGYCFPKDLQAFSHLVEQLGYDFPLLRQVARHNDEAVDAAFAKIQEGLWNLHDKRVALLGLAYKPGTDDVRFAPALTLARRLLEAGAEVVGFDPKANATAQSELPELVVAASAYDALTGAHCAVVCTEWEDFRSLDLKKVAELMAFPVLVDARNVLEPAKAVESGFTYFSMGRAPLRPPLGKA